MLVKIHKWGNGLGIRIPKIIAQGARLRPGASVELSVEEGRLILAPVKRKRYSLKELVDQITPENLPGETLWGPSVGNEIW